MRDESPDRGREKDLERRGKRDRRPEEPRPPRGLVLLIVAICSVLLVTFGSRLSSAGEPLSLNEFQDLIERNEVVEVTFVQNEGEVVLRDGALAGAGSSTRSVNFIDEKDAIAYSDRIAELAARAEAPIDTVVKVRHPNLLLIQFVLYLLPVLIVVGLLYFVFMRQLRGPGAPGSVLNFGKSRGRLATKESTGVTFKDVAGIDEAKDEVREIVEFLRNPGKFKRLGGRIPKGVMLIGPPGTGKTLLAKAIAGEADVPFFSVCGSDFVEMFVGVGASRVRDLFKQARESSPCIVFLDEVDAVGRRRGSGLGGGHDEREQTLNQILVEMDGFDTDEGIILVAATNRPDVLDPALLRPGRFDRQIVLDMPDVKGRTEILRVHSRSVKLAPDVDLDVIARATPMFSGAELEAIINEAAILAALRNRDAVGMQDFEEARDRIRWGRQKKSRQIVEEDRRATAYHEAGHALVSVHVPECEPLHKVTIIPRGAALGVTMTLPERDRYDLKKKKVLAQITMCYGGRIAEQICTGDVSTGARNDIEKATELARKMVCEWGMSEALGPVNYAQDEETIFLGREITRTQRHSEATGQLIDKEIRSILDQCFKNAERIISKNRDKLERLAEALLRHETLSGTDIERVLDGCPIDDLRPREETCEGAQSSEADHAPPLPATGAAGAPAS